MTGSEIEQRLAALGIKLPEPAAPVAAYVPVVVAGGLAHVSGQLPFISGQLVTGRLGEDVSLEDGVLAAQACGVMREDHACATAAPSAGEGLTSSASRW